MKSAHHMPEPHLTGIINDDQVNCFGNCRYPQSGHRSHHRRIALIWHWNLEQCHRQPVQLETVLHLAVFSRRSTLRIADYQHAIAKNKNIAQ